MDASNDKRFAVEFGMTRRHVAYLKSLDDSAVRFVTRDGKTTLSTGGKSVKYFYTRAVPQGCDVPEDAALLTRERAEYFVRILTACRRIVKVVELN
jgi:hypothetical protein